jgi:hypothetical protein
MPRLPDHFDLWVRKAREQSDPVRQTDFVLGALMGLRDWHFLNIGSVEKPQAARTQIDQDACVLVFSGIDRLEELVEISGAGKHVPKGQPPPAITVPSAAALPWCVECKVGLLINPSEEAVLIPLNQVESFCKEWQARGKRQAAGFWIPNMTSEEEDFWQEHGL